MDEKILIKSETNATFKAFLKWAPIVFFGIAALISILLSIPKEESYTYYDFFTHSDRTRTYTSVGWKNIFNFGDDTLLFVLFVLGCLCLLLAIIFGIIYLVNGKCELVITENNVKGKALFGKEVVLPLYMVSAYSTRKFLSTISVATASGLTQFALIENYREIGDVLAKKINERQQKTQISTQPPADSSSMDDLKKLKELLDLGIITQEEFDAKKKQLLGL